MRKSGLIIGVISGAVFIYALIAFVTWDAALDFGEWGNEQRLLYFLVTVFFMAFGGIIGGHK
jgi:hypothetical protein